MAPTLLKMTGITLFIFFGAQPLCSSRVVAASRIQEPQPGAQKPIDADELIDLLSESYQRILLGEVGEARKRYEEAKPHLHDSALVDVLVYAAAIAERLGQYEECVEFASKGLALAKATHDAEGEAVCLNNLGLGYRYLGKIEEALIHYNQAREKNEGLGHTDRAAQNITNSGLIHFLNGDFDKALALYGETKEIISTHQNEGWTREQHHITSSNIAAVFERVGETREAQKIYRTILEDQELSLSLRANVLTNLGRVHRDLDDPHFALDLFEQAAAIFAQIGEPGSVANLLLTHGRTLCDNLNRHSDAQALLRKALALSREISDKTEEIFDLYYLARCCLHTHELEAAKTYAKDAVQLATKTDYREGLWLSLFAKAQVDEKLGDPEQALLNYKACLSHLEEVRQENVAKAYRAGFLEDKQHIYAAAVRLILAGNPSGTKPSENQIAEAFEVAERARARSLLDRLQAQPATLQTVQDNLSPGELIVDPILGPLGTTIFLITHQSSSLLRLPPLPDLEKWVQNGRRDIWETGNDHSSPAIQNITRHLLQPIFGAIPPGITDLILIPDLSLSTLSFAPLRIGNATNSPRIVERYGVSYAPSSSCLVALRRKAPPPPPGSSLELTAFTAPLLSNRFRKDTTLLDRLVTRLSLKPLKNADKEVTRLAKHLPPNHRVFSREEAGFSRLKGIQSVGSRIIHFATHSVIDSTYPDQSALILAPEENNDGVVRLTDVLGLQLNVSLVTLSTCESARGKFIRGEGVQSFARAFLSTGAHSVVSSLWPVSDDHSPVFMDTFYYHLSRGNSTAQALREAQLDLLDHPIAKDLRFWSSYIVVGDGSHALYEKKLPHYIRPFLWATGIGLLAFFITSIAVRKRRAEPC